VTEGDFKNDSKQHKIITYQADGKLSTKPIFNQWMEDRQRRIYETVEFIPFGKDDLTPPHVFNTFESF
jgi:antitoxin component YwqK of YwqJK toxin-antitoxin module